MKMVLMHKAGSWKSYGPLNYRALPRFDEYHPYQCSHFDIKTIILTMMHDTYQLPSTWQVRIVHLKHSVLLIFKVKLPVLLSFQTFWLIDCILEIQPAVRMLCLLLSRFKTLVKILDFCDLRKFVLAMEIIYWAGNKDSLQSFPWTQINLWLWQNKMQKQVSERSVKNNCNFQYVKKSC